LAGVTIKQRLFQIVWCGGGWPHPRWFGRL